MICGKTIYPTKESAISAIEGIKNDPTSKANRKPQKTYWCGDCNGYHIHSKQKKHVTKSKAKNLDTQGERNHKYAPEKLIIRNYSSKPIR